jgi:putative polysaccharide biosynthesis protein
MASFRSIKKKLRHPGRIVNDILKIMRLSAKLEKPCTPGWFKCLLRGIKMRFEEEYDPENAFRLGLFLPDAYPDNYKLYTSKRKMLRAQSLVNPRSWSHLTEDKGIFYKFCKSAKIPIPELYALFFRDIAGWSFKNPVLKSRENWISFFQDDLPDDFIIKPMRGVYGNKVMAFKRKNDAFSYNDNRIVKAEDIYNFMKEDPEFDRFVVQQRLKSHANLIKLSATDNLQTIRLNTLFDKTGNANVVQGSFRVITSGRIVDNFQCGKSGNLLVKVDMETGIIEKAVIVHSDGKGVKPVEKHPDTGIVFKGFQIPAWEEIIDLVKSSSIHFLPIRYIGWDVGITDHGPVIVEANMWSDPPNRFNAAGEIYNTLMNEE